MTFRLKVTGGAFTGRRVDAESVLSELLSQRPRVAVITADDDPGAITDDELNAYAERFASVGTSLVSLARPRLGLSGDIAVIDYDGRSGMRALTRYLLSLGHRDILYVGIRAHSAVFDQRYRGFLEVLEEAGIPHDAAGDLAFEPDRDIDVSSIVTRYRHGSPFTAVVAAADVIALDAIHALRALGLRVPQDVSVTGFDDMPYAGELIVPLTTVHAPFAEMGATAVRAGIEGIKDVVMPTRLVVRESAMAAAR